VIILFNFLPKDFDNFLTGFCLLIFGSVFILLIGASLYFFEWVRVLLFFLALAFMVGKLSYSLGRSFNNLNDDSSSDSNDKHIDLHV
jgi:membrane protein implicated in regulation of membrane protease activity